MRRNSRIGDWVALAMILSPSVWAGPVKTQTTRAQKNPNEIQVISKQKQDSSEKGSMPAPATAVSEPEFKRSGNISFEDQLVEGMNRNPFDSLTSVQSEEMRSMGRIYKVKTRFTTEIKTTIEETNYGQ